MADGVRPSIPRRQVLGSDVRLSALTVSVDPPLVAPPAADDRMVALLRRARTRGVATFDVATARFPPRAERLIARAFPDPDPEISAIVVRSVDSLARERTPDDQPVAAENPESALALSLDRSRRRLDPVPVSIVEWEVEPLRPNEDRSGGMGGVPSIPLPSGTLWALRLLPGVAGLPKETPSPPLFSGPLSLLEPDLVAGFEDETTPQNTSLIARDPFGSGRLDGSRFASRAGLSGPTAGPVDVRRLHEEFDPVLRLGFLTEHHRRTLAQAALQFVLHWGWVATVVVPLPDPERFDEVLGFGTQAPISPEELARLGFVK
jgi:aryl-alcohol dehydrogenase-like predicted oxidoreductase